MAEEMCDAAEQWEARGGPGLGDEREEAKLWGLRWCLGRQRVQTIMRSLVIRRSRAWSGLFLGTTKGASGREGLNSPEMAN